MKIEESERGEDEDCVPLWGCFCFLCQYQSTTHSLQQIWSFRMVQLGLNGVILFLTTKIANKIYYVVSSASAATSKMRRFMIETGFDTHDLLNANPLNPCEAESEIEILRERERERESCVCFSARSPLCFVLLELYCQCFRRV